MTPTQQLYIKFKNDHAGLEFTWLHVTLNNVQFIVTVHKSLK